MNCSKLFGKTSFESYSEFYMALAVARVLGDYGECLDMRDINIEKDMITGDHMAYFKVLIDRGYINLGVPNKDVVVDESELDINISAFDKIGDKLFREENGNYIWDYDLVVNEYKKVEPNFVLFSKMGNLVLHLVAFFILKRNWGYYPKSSKLHINIDNMQSKSTFLYVNLYSILLTMPWVGEYILLNVDFDSDTNVDIKYSIFCNNGYMSKRYKQWSVSEKLNIMKDLGMGVGSIVCWYQRAGIRENNTFGRITRAIIVRIDEIGDDFIAVRSVAVNKTKEESYLDYLESENQFLYSDLSTPTLYERNETLNIYNLGIENYFFEETNLLTKIDKAERVTKRVTIDGKEGDVEMSGVDAIYWILCQHDFDFDRALYREMYSGGDDLMWDLYGDDTSLEQ